MSSLTPEGALVEEMTLAEKLGQMTQVSNQSISPGEVADHAIGSVLSGGNGLPTTNTPTGWADMVGSFVDAAADTRLGIPLLYGVDAVHGHALVEGATVFPHNIGLGAAHDPALVERIGAATAAETRATGIHWTFAPTVAVPQDIRWGRTYEGYGRDPELVSRLGAACVRGLQAGNDGQHGVLACAKHYVADGGTTWGTRPRLDWTDWWDGWGEEWQIDQGDTRISEAELRSTHLPPYAAAVGAGVASVMASYSSWNGTKLHASRYLLTDMLKEELGFDGFVVSDWKAVDQIDADYDESVIAAINAGIDMVMVPDDFHRFLGSMERAVSSGRIPTARIDDAVRRILGAKERAGLYAPTWTTPPLETIGSPSHRVLAAEAVRKSAVLLRNEGALPLPGDGHRLDVAGAAADDIGLQCGGWTAGWQGGPGPITEGSTLLDGLRAAGHEVSYDPSGRFEVDQRAAIGIVCIAEDPYAEGPGDAAVPTARPADREVFRHMRSRCDRLVLVIYSGRPLVVTDMIEEADAVVAAWLPGSEASALADLLTGRRPFEARTPQAWPRASADLGDPSAIPLFEVGHGLRPPAAAVGPQTTTTQTEVTT